MKDDLITIEFASNLIDRAISTGDEQAEFFFKTAKSLSIDVKDQKIDTLETSVSYGYSVRVIKNNRVGFSYSNDLKEAEKVIDNALEAAKYAEPDDFLGLPSYQRPSAVEVYDNNIAMISESDAMEKILLMEQAAFNKDKRIKKTRKAGGSFTTGEIYIFNSLGVALNYIATGCTAQIMAIAENGNENQIGWDFCGSRFLRDIDFEKTGYIAATRALDQLNSSKISSLKGFILLDSSVAVEFLSLLAGALSSESVQKGKSLLANKLGQKVCNEKFNVIDNGIFNRMLGSRPFDDEGVPTQNKMLIENGILKTFLYNTYTARKDGVQSTGNAIRGGFHNPPSVSPTNLYIEASDAEPVQDFMNLVKNTNKGIYVFETMGMHTANPISGEFSVGVSGLWIEKGEFKHPVKEAVISGNILELFNKIILIGDDLRFYGNIGSPPLLIEGIDISG
jgi:PmbA protein